MAEKKSLGHGDVSRRRRLLQLVLMSMFAAMSYVVLIVFRIPYPAPVGTPFLHFGNAVVILAALLIGGWQGGLAGAVGMGLNDLVYGYGWLAMKTIVLKFGIGLFTGLVASTGRRHPECNPRIGLGVAAGISLVLGGVILTGKTAGWEAFAKVSAVAYIFLLILGVLLSCVTIASLRLQWLTNEWLFAALGAVIGIAWNAVGEFASGAILGVASGARWQAAMLASLISLPATLINGVFSIVAALLLYVPVKTALCRAHLDSMLAK